MATVYFCEIENLTDKKRLSDLGKSIVKQIAGKKSADIEFSKTENGKPYIKNLRDFHFNISHSHNAVAVAFSGKPVGIDIEKLRNVNLKVADRFFSKAEQDYIRLSPDFSNRRFFEIWTKKEAYIKKHGQTLKNLSKAKTDGIYTAERDGYIISVCSDENEDIEIISFDIENLENL